MTIFAWDVANDPEFPEGIEGSMERFLGTQALSPEGSADLVYQFFLLDDDDGNLDNGTPNCDVIDRHARSRALDQAWKVERCPMNPDSETCCWDSNGSGAVDDCGLDETAAPMYPFPDGCPSVDSNVGTSCSTIRH